MAAKVSRMCCLAFACTSSGSARLAAAAGNVGTRHKSVPDRSAGGKTTEWLKDPGMGFVSTQSKPGGNVQRHLVAAMRDTARGRPAVLFQHFENAEKFDQAITERAIELQNIPVGAETGVADQIAGILERKKIFAGSQRARVIGREFGLEVVV